MFQKLIRALIGTWALVVFSTLATAQVAVNENGQAPHSSAMLDVQSTTKGMLIPSMTSNQRNNISNPALGLMVYDINQHEFYYYTGNQWITPLINPTDYPSEIADAAGTTTVDTEKNADDDIIRFRINGDRMTLKRSGLKLAVMELNGSGLTAIGEGAANLLTPNNQSSVFGYRAGNDATSSSDFFGAEAGLQITGNSNVAIGRTAGSGGLTSLGNTIVGLEAGSNLTTGHNNLMIGFRSGLNNVTGSKNVFIGFQAGRDHNGTEKLVIHNNESTSPLLFGDRATGQLTVNGKLSFEDKYISTSGELKNFESGDASNGLLIKSDGKIGINNFVPDEQLAIQGDMQSSGEFEFNDGLDARAIASDDNQNMYMIAGRLDSDGDLNTTYSSTISIASTDRFDTGKYRIEIEFENDSNAEFYAKKPTVIANAFHSGGENRYCTIESLTNTQVEITVRNQNGERKNAALNFIIIGRKN